MIVAPDCGMKYLPRDVAQGKLQAMVEAAQDPARGVRGLTRWRRHGKYCSPAGTGGRSTSGLKATPREQDNARIRPENLPLCHHRDPRRAGWVPAVVAGAGRAGALARPRRPRLRGRACAQYAAGEPEDHRYRSRGMARSTSPSAATASCMRPWRAATSCGWIPTAASQELFANTGGRVLGFDFDAQGRMIAADAMKGLLAIGADRRVTVLTDRVTPRRSRSAMPTPSSSRPTGTIYFTDASTRFAPAQWGGTFEASVLDILEQSVDRPRAGPRPGNGENPRRGPRPLVRQRHRTVGRRPDPVRQRDRAATASGRSTAASDVDVRQRLAPGEGAARQPAGLSGQPDARARRPHLGGLLPSRAIRRSTTSRTSPSCARSLLRLPRALWPLGQDATGTCSRSPRTAAWSPTCRIRAAPIRRPPA